jgi:hypothetical protein
MLKPGPPEVKIEASASVPPAARAPPGGYQGTGSYQRGLRGALPQAIMT